MTKYLNGKMKKHLTLSADDLKVVKCYVDAIFSFQPDFKSHTEDIMTMGQGTI